MKKISNVYKAILICVLMLSLACSKEENSAGGVYVVKNPPKDPTSIVTQYSYIPLESSKTYNLNAAVIPLEKAKEPLEYSSNNGSVAGVDSNGKITTYNNGVATIKVSLKNDKNIYKNIIINSYNKADAANNSKVRAVYVNKTYISLDENKNDAYTIDASIRPLDAEDELVYISTDSNVATVTDKGVVSSKKAGNAAIIIYAKNNPAKYAQLAVEVKAKSSSNGGGSSFTPPAGIAPIDLNADPFSLIAKYQVLDYSINGGEILPASTDSNLRVNVNLDELGAGIVKILMYVKLNGKEVRLIQKKNMNDYGSIPEIFTSLGAKITGDYTMEFTLDPVNYSELAKQGLVNTGETLVLNIGKLENLVPAGGLGGDIVFDESTVPVESGNGQAGGSNESGSQTGSDVTKVILNKSTHTPYTVNEKFTIIASVEPSTAANKTITWKSSDNNTATVTQNGEVTVLRNGKATITATASNGVSASLNIIPVTTPQDFMLEVDKQDLILGLIEEFQIKPIPYPFIISVEDTDVTYRVADDSIATVTDTGLVRAVAEGETIVYVTIAGVERQCYINVLPKSAANVPVERIILTEESGLYDLVTGSFRISATVEPSTAGDKRLKYQVTNPEICQVNDTGLVTFKKPGETTIIVSAYNNSEVQAVYSLKIQSLPTKIAFEKIDIGIIVGEESTLLPVLEGLQPSSRIIYSSDNPAIASVDESTGKVTGHNIGTTTIKAVTENDLEATYDVHVYTPLNADDVSSLQGTYQIIDFEQSNGTLDVSTTAKYGKVERMVGEMTIEVNNNTVTIKSKIQMDSSAMNTFGGVLGQGKEEARKGQFQYTEYSPAVYNKNGFGTAGKTSAQVTFDNGNLKLYQTWKELGIATVNVNTWIKKKSNDIKDLQPNKFHFYYSDINGTKKANAVAHHPDILPPDEEPYYTYGLIAR